MATTTATLIQQAAHMTTIVTVMQIWMDSVKVQRLAADRKTLGNVFYIVDYLHYILIKRCFSIVNYSDYTRITSVEQRRRYKTEFDNDFAEYRQLFSVIDRVKQRFAQLEEELRNVRDNQQYRVRVTLI